MNLKEINLALRFFLEIGALVGVGYWGWQSYEGWLQYLTGIGLPLLMMSLWGTFAVPGDPSRSGNAPIPISGKLRLVLELAVFGFGLWAFYKSGQSKIALAMATLLVLHHLLYLDRLRWLWKQ